MKYLTDSTWAIDYLNGRPAAHALYPMLDADGLAISIITYMELCEGVEGNRDPEQAERILRNFLRGVTVLPFSRRVARRAAQLRGDLRRQRRPVEQRALDILIAATALTYGLVMVTSDADYDDIPDLKRLNPRLTS